MLGRLLALCALVAAPAAAGQEWELVWADEFDADGAPDPARWGYDTGGNGWGNSELQHYTARPENVRVAGGALVIEARAETYGANAYTSARLVTRGRAAWTYGRVEARIQLPVGQGLWPAFWMLPSGSPYGGWPASGEIDIMEYRGQDPRRVLGTLHYGGGSYAPCRASRGTVTGHCYSGGAYVLPTGTFADDYHTFAVEWEPREIRWLVDGQTVQRQSYWYSGAAVFPAPFDQPFHILLNMAVGGSFVGPPNASTVFPQQMRVDYVRVYRHTGAYPTAALDAPAEGAVFASGETVPLAASASAGARIEFLQGDHPVAAAPMAPATAAIAAADGCYALRVRATSSVGYTTVTPPVAVRVGAGCPPGSRAPYLMTPLVVPGRLEAELYDLGGPDVAFRDVSAANDAGSFRAQEGVDIRTSPDAGGGWDVTGISAGEWLTYTVDVAEAGTYRFVARIAGPTTGRLAVALDGADLWGDVVLPVTANDRTFTDALLGEAFVPAGRHVLRLNARSGGYVLNRIVVTQALPSASAPAPAGGGWALRVVSPARDRAEVEYRVPEAATVDVALVDAQGRRVARLAGGAMAAGTYRTAVETGGLAAGAYLCVLTSGRVRRVARFVVP